MAMSPQQLIEKDQNVASLPTVYTKLNELVDSPSSSTGDIAAVLALDANLVARLLKLANSAYYGFQQKVDSISRAVTMIGTSQLRDLVLAVSVYDMFEDVPNDVVNADSFWKHSIATGVVARVIASFRREMNVERYFVMGLLHDIGRLLMYRSIPEQAREALALSRKDGMLLYQAERQVLGFHHGDVGGALLKSWNLPKHTVNAVAYHHDPMAADEYDGDASILHVADIIVNAQQFGSSGEILVPTLVRESWECLGIPETVIPFVIELLEKEYAAAMELIKPPLKQAALA